MNPNTILKWSLSIVLLIAVDSDAAIRDIQPGKLPQVSSLPKVLSEVAELEPYAKNWTGNWQYDVPKAKVVGKMKANLKVLQSAVSEYPDNPELLLLTGLAAHYAYNLDIDSAYDVAKQSFERAHTLAPADVRPSWFLDMHECQTSHPDVGMRGFLSIEDSPAVAQVPASFWEDYMICATITDMPAHVLRAATRVAVAERSDFMKFLINAAKSRFVPADPQSSYQAKQVWKTMKSDGEPIFMSSMCGVIFSARGEWKLSFPDVKDGQCVAQMQTGPYPAKGIDVFPNILLVVRAAKAGETLDDFLKSSIHDPNPTKIPVRSCPAAQCLAYELVAKDMYKESGDGHAIFTVFERDEPQFPGIALEQPTRPNAPPDNKIHAFHPDERINRLNGKLYYLVLLDSADSVLDRAKMDYEFYLRSMQLE